MSRSTSHVTTSWDKRKTRWITITFSAKWIPVMFQVRYSQQKKKTEVMGALLEKKNSMVKGLWGTRNGKQNEIYNLRYCRCHKVILGKFDLPVNIFYREMGHIKHATRKQKGWLRCNISSPGGLEPPTFRLTAERANRLRHGDDRICVTIKE